MEKDNYPLRDTREQEEENRSVPRDRKLEKRGFFRFLQATSVNRSVPVQANSVILLISASFFPPTPPPFSPLETWSKRQPRPDIPPPRISDISRIGVSSVPFDMPDRGQKPAGMRHGVGRSRMKGGGTSPFRNWSQDNSGATVLNIDSIVRAAAARFFAIDPNPEIRFTRSRYASRRPEFSELVRSRCLFGKTRVNMSFLVTGNHHPR